MIISFQKNNNNPAKNSKKRKEKFACRANKLQEKRREIKPQKKVTGYGYKNNFMSAQFQVQLREVKSISTCVFVELNRHLFPIVSLRMTSYPLIKYFCK